MYGGPPFNGKTVYIPPIGGYMCVETPSVKQESVGWAVRMKEENTMFICRKSKQVGLDVCVDLR